jgi:hypothetical protein
MALNEAEVDKAIKELSFKFGVYVIAVGYHIGN